MRWIFLFLLLAGCGGGGGDTAHAPDRFAAFDQLSASVAALDVTPVAQLPDGGQAHYTGAAALNIPVGGAAAIYVAELTVSIGFGPDAVPMTGTMSAFQSATGGRLTGTMAVSDGRFNLAADPDRDYQFTAVMGGTLADGATVHALDGHLMGDFRGRDGAAIAGVLFGDVTTGDVIDIFDGSFVATQPP